jgi:hypothetical protein
MSRDFEDEDTLVFVRADDGDDELALEGVEQWFWTDDERKATDVASQNSVCMT